MNDNSGRDDLASERTLLAAERTFSAWIRTGLAAVGGGLAIARALVFNSNMHKAMSFMIGGLLVTCGAGIFVYALMSYHRVCVRLSGDGLLKNSLGAMIAITAVLLIIAALVFWIIFQ